MNPDLQQVAATGESMGAHYADATAFLVRNTTVKAIRPGRVIVLSRDESMIGHRFIMRKRWKGGNWLVTRGDGNPYIDPPWPSEAHPELREAIAMQVGGDWVALDSLSEKLRGWRMVLSTWLLIAIRLLSRRSLYRD